MPRAVHPGPPVGQAVGVEHQDGPGRQLDRLLLVGGQPPDAFAAHPEQDPLVSELKLPHLPAADQQRGVVTGVGEGQLPGPGVVDHVDAADRGRVPGGLNPVLVRGGQRPAPLVEFAHDVRGRLLVLRERPQGRTQLTHDRRRPRASALDVADDDAHPPGRQRDDVVPVAAHLGLDPLALRLKRFRGHVPAGDLQAIQFRDRLRQQALLEGQRGLPFRLEQHRVVDRDSYPAGDRADQVAVRCVVVALVTFGEPGQGQAHHAEQFSAGVQRRRDH